MRRSVPLVQAILQPAKEGLYAPTRKDIADDIVDKAYLFFDICFEYLRGRRVWVESDPYIFQDNIRIHKEIRDVAIGAFLRAILGEDLYSDYGFQIRTERDLPSESDCIVIVTRRQIGKTTTMCIAIGMLVTFVKSDRDISIGVTSVKFSTAKQMMTLIHFFITLYKEKTNGTIYQDAGKQQTQDVHTYVNTPEGCYISLLCMAATKTMRGQSFPYLFCDELATIDEDVYKKIIVPIIQHKGRMFFSATTPATTPFFENFLEEHNVSSGTPFCIHWFTEVCGKCRKRKELLKCWHNINRKPYTKTARKECDAWNSSLDQATLIAEILGESSSSITYCFERGSVEGIEHPSRIIDDNLSSMRGETFFIAMDPSFAGASEMGIITNYSKRCEKTGRHNMVVSIFIYGSVLKVQVGVELALLLQFKCVLFVDNNGLEIGDDARHYLG